MPVKGELSSGDLISRQKCVHNKSVITTRRIKLSDGPERLKVGLFLKINVSVTFRYNNVTLLNNSTREIIKK